MKNIVWLVSYPKSGNTWFRMFLTNYLTNAGEPVPLANIKSSSMASDAGCFEEITGLDPFELTPDEVELYRPGVCRVLSLEAEEGGQTLYKKAHDAYTVNTSGEPLFPEEVSKQALCFVRNPLDVCVSYANHSAANVGKTITFLLNEEAHLAGSRTGQLRQKLLSWSGHVKSWREQSAIPTRFVRYEDMQWKPAETFSSMIRFLGLDYDEERLSRALAFSDFKLLQQMEQEKGFGEKMQLCKNFFWKGKIGNYREHLSEEQVKRITEYHYETMKLFGYIDASGELAV